MTEKSFFDKIAPMNTLPGWFVSVLAAIVLAGGGALGNSVSSRIDVNAAKIDKIEEAQARQNRELGELYTLMLKVEKSQERIIDRLDKLAERR